jgi:ferrous iron transport protein B
MAIFSASCFKQNFENEKANIVVEMPNYKLLMFKNVAINVIESKAFVAGAGKRNPSHIYCFTVLLHGPGKKFKMSDTIKVQQK